MAHRVGIVGALIVAAVAAGSATAVGAEREAPGAVADGGCSARGEAAALTPARSQMGQRAESAARKWGLHPVANNVGINSPYVLLGTCSSSASVLYVDRQIHRVIVWVTGDSGTTWQPVAKLDAASSFAAASDGQPVDLVVAVARSASSSSAVPT